MHLELRFPLDGTPAIDADPQSEAVRMLRALANRIEEHGAMTHGDQWTMRDWDGVAVGTARVVDPHEERSPRSPR